MHRCLLLVCEIGKRHLHAALGAQLLHTELRGKVLLAHSEARLLVGQRSLHCGLLIHAPSLQAVGLLLHPCLLLVGQVCKGCLQSRLRTQLLHAQLRREVLLIDRNISLLVSKRCLHRGLLVHAACLQTIRFLLDASLLLVREVRERRLQPRLRAELLRPQLCGQILLAHGKACLLVCLLGREPCLLFGVELLLRLLERRLQPRCLDVAKLLRKIALGFRLDKTFSQTTKRACPNRLCGTTLLGNTGLSARFTLLNVHDILHVGGHEGFSRARLRKGLCSNPFRRAHLKGLKIRSELSLRGLQTTDSDLFRSGDVPHVPHLEGLEFRAELGLGRLKISHPDLLRLRLLRRAHLESLEIRTELGGRGCHGRRGHPRSRHSPRTLHLERLKSRVKACLSSGDAARTYCSSRNGSRTLHLGRSNRRGGTQSCCRRTCLLGAREKRFNASIELPRRGHLRPYSALVEEILSPSKLSLTRSQSQLLRGPHVAHGRACEIHCGLKVLVRRLQGHPLRDPKAADAPVDVRKALLELRHACGYPLCRSSCLPHRGLRVGKLPARVRASQNICCFTGG